MTWRLVLLALALGAPAIAGAPPGGPAEAANPPLPAIELTLAAGHHRHRYRVELARTPLEQARGLMQRMTLPRRHGMLFPMDPPREATFWMEGTIVPLDLVFIAPDHRVRRIAADAVPFDRTGIPSGGAVAAVLELNAGEAARIGLHPGDAVAYTLDGTAAAR